MTAPDREPRRRAALGIGLSLALHAAALAAVVAGHTGRAPQPAARLAEIAVDIVAPPAPAEAPEIPAAEASPADAPPAETAVAETAVAEAPPPAEPAPYSAPEAAPEAFPETASAEPPPVAPPARKPKPAAPPAAARPMAAAPAPPAPPSSAPSGPPTAPVPAGPTIAAALLDSPQPPYPAAARRRGQQGRVVLSVRVSPSGAPEAVVLVSSSGVEALDAAARDAVRGWRFRPALANGVAVAATVEVPVRFRLDEE